MTSDHAHIQHCLMALDNLTTSILLFDRQRRVIYVNPAAEALLEVSARHFEGMSPDELFVGSSRVLGKLVERALRSVEPVTERSCELVLSNGHVIRVDCTASPVEDSVRGRQILLELQRVDRQLRISREKQFILQQQATRALVRGLAHEIKNPLGGLRGAAQLLQSELPSPELREYTRIIIEEADRLQHLVDQMLGPNRPSRKRAVNLHQALERVCALVQAETVSVKGPRTLQFMRDYDPSIPSIYADPDQLIQAILNIVRNAVQAMEGCGHIVLRTRVLRQYTIGEQLHKLVALLEVVDNGPGISEELRETLFFPMVTGRADGTGLGLSIAQSLINQHNGLIECQPVAGETTFRIIIPLEKLEDDQEGAGFRN